MKFLCPFCSKEKPLRIECPEGSESAACPRCKKRFRLKLFQAVSIDAAPYPGGFSYTIASDQNGRPGIEKFSSRNHLALQQKHSFLAVRRGREIVGLADQTKNFWFPVDPVETPHPLLHALLLSLAWPISALVLLQTTKFFPALYESIISNTVSFIMALIATVLLAGAPLGLWVIRTIFPYGPRRERIRGYDPRL